MPRHCTKPVNCVELIQRVSFTSAIDRTTQVAWCTVIANNVSPAGGGSGDDEDDDDDGVQHH